MRIAVLQATAFIMAATTVAANAEMAVQAPGVGSDGSIQVPNVDYQKDWAFLGTYSVQGEDGAGDLHTVYTQPETIAAYRETGKFPDGTVLIKDLFKTKTDNLTTGRVSWATERAGWFVMVKDSANSFPDNPLWGDGWGWAFFEPDAPKATTTVDYKTECLGCHEPVRKTDLSYVQGYPALQR
ncbi:MAG: cytochrome P460 family protein [Geminicoccales bacterium]